MSRPLALDIDGTMTRPDGGIDDDGGRFVERDEETLADLEERVGGEQRGP